MTKSDTIETNPVIRSGTIADYEAIELLCNERYGIGYVNRQTVAHWTQCPALFLVAEQDGCFAGFSVFVPKTAEAVAEYMAMPIEDVLAASAGKPSLIYKSAAVVMTYEHRGIMRIMVTHQLEKAKEMGFGAVFASAWEYGGVVPMAGMFAGMGFEPLYRREMLWYHIKDYVCVVCNGACTCNAVIYQKKL
ncbi:MAG: hypothetical protein RSC74_08585 [Hydrogenoanaerobacterium sp.]